MRRLKYGIALLLALFLMSVFTLATFAASPHFKRGGVPVCTFSGTTSIPVTCTGTIAGLGNQDLNLHLSVSGFALYQ